MFKPILLYASSCPQNRVKVVNYGGQEVGFVCVYNTSNPDATSNEVWVGEAEISSADAAFNDGGSNANTFDSGQVVIVNITSNLRWSHWRGVIRDEQTLEEYETGWIDVETNAGPFYVSNVWQGDPFRSFNSYKATIWVTNDGCQAWKPLDMPFFICPQGTGCKLKDKEFSVSLYPNPATDFISLQGMDHIHRGDRIEATITDGLGKLVKRVPNLQKRQISVSELSSGMYYFTVFRNQEQIAIKKLIIQ